MRRSEPDSISDPADAGSADAVIIGGGIIGAATASFLARAGLRPVLVERRPALASLTSAHSMESFRAQFDEPENVAMMRESIAFYEAFAEKTGLPDWDVGIHQQGYLFLTTEPARVGDFRRRVASQHALGLTDVEFLTGEEARRRFPYVSEQVLGATFRQRDGWLSAHQAAHGFARAAGVPILLETAVTGIVLRGGRAAGVRTERGLIASPIVIIAAGPYAGKVAAWAGVALPLRIVRRHRVTIGAHPLIPQGAPMVIDGDTGAHWRPERPGAALAWAQDNEPPGEPVDAVRANPMFPFEVLEGVARLAPFWEAVAGGLKRNQVYLQAGQYTDTPDGKPIIGPHPDIPGLFFNTGYGGHGVMAAPGGGRLLADLITGRGHDINNPFSYRRLAALYAAAAHRGLL